MSAVAQNTTEDQAPRSRTPVFDAQQQLIYDITQLRFSDLPDLSDYHDLRGFSEKLKKLEFAIAAFGEVAGAEVRFHTGTLLEPDEIRTCGLDAFEHLTFALDTEADAKEEALWEQQEGRGRVVIDLTGARFKEPY